MRKIFVVAILLLPTLLAPGPAGADTCSSPGKTCLFVDSSGCAITCVGKCWVTTGGCAFGFGWDAICRCHDKQAGCKKTCQEGLSRNVGQFALAVSNALTDCELRAAAEGRRGGDCYFDLRARQAIEDARKDAKLAIGAVCTDQDVFDCFGIATLDDLASRLLKNAESSQAGASRSIFDDGPTEAEPFLLDLSRQP